MIDGHTSHSGCTHSHFPTHKGRNEGLSQQKRLYWTLLLTAGYAVAEVVGGYFSGSLALIADSGHMLTDAAAIGMALFASWLSTHPAGPQKTYGYHRLEILVACINGMTLTAVALWIVWEAFQRFQTATLIQAPLMGEIALGGLVINLIAVKLLHSDSKSHLTTHSVYLHIIGDLLGSIGTLIAGVAIYFFHWNWADPIISLVIAGLILWSTTRLLIQGVDILLEGSPSHISVPQVKSVMLAQQGVESVHDLHVWTITSGKDALSAHVSVSEGTAYPEMLTRLQEVLKLEFGLSHLTLQLEPLDFEEDELHF
ncbi:MAG: cation diffusion facilitator family transporter [Cyanobacteria bacterium]|nr:cation diffusion facilitator family transporter [Cyanobacteriota bacterium]